MKIIRKIYKKILNISVRIAKKVFKFKDNLTKEKLTKKLMKYDVISFDIFDTLITRTIFNPDDIFPLMESKLSNIKLKDSILNMRKNAEKEARIKLNKDVNLDEIYDEFGLIYGYNKKDVDRIKQLEIDLELELTYPRKDMLDILKTLMDSGKKVILTSDMYLSKDVIIKMLEKCGYKEKIHYKRFYLSNDKNMRKDDGTIWKYIKLLYFGMKFIHVGDNIHSDYNIPTQMGLKAIYIKNPREQLRLSSYCDGINKDIENRTISDSLFLGYIINEQIFNSPFSNGVDSLEKISKTLIAPMIYSLLHSIDENTNKKDHLLFLAREGYYLEKLYRDYCKINKKDERKHDYFLASRTSVIGATIYNVDDIIKSLKRDYKGTLKSLLKSVFNIDHNGKDYDIVLPDDIDKIKDDVLEYKEDIINQSKIYKDNYIKYIDSVINIKKENPIIIDLGYSGTIQYHLSKMIDKNLKGIYLTNSSSVKKYSDKSELIFVFDINDDKSFEDIYHYSLILEYFLCAPYGQLQYFELDNKKIKPVYNDEKLDKLKKTSVEKIYNYVVEYLNRIADINKIYNTNFSKNILSNSYKSMVESSVITRCVKDNFTFMDSFTSTIPKNVFKIISRY